MSEEMKFEKAMEKLEKIVEALEEGNLPLEDALKKYEEGVKLSRMCQKRLTQAEKKIEVLTKSVDGSLSKEPFELEENASPGKSRKTRKASHKVSADEEDMLL